MTFDCEWILTAWTGRTLVALAFTSAIVSGISYFKGWKELGRKAFITHVASVFSVIALIFILFFGHRYEFQYIWKHLNNEMPMRFVLSAFWGGQEGGFLLWMFWHNILALFVIKSADKWEPKVMVILASIESFLSMMLLGIYFGDFQLGLDPFLLLREAPENIGLPWTGMSNYLTNLPFFADGQGLNPLLQNYWMTIHPPTLFLGFASTSIPFAYAIAGLWEKDYKGWITPALPWAYFGIGILGAGILMGGAWAYEALSFGGFWAWDPVENSSLVPWLILVAGAHLMIINKNKKKPTALFSTIYLTLLAFLLVLYSTFLTKSGILGDTSVHSFVDSGILPQLLAYLLTFVLLAHTLLLGTTKRRLYHLASTLLVMSLMFVKEYALASLGFIVLQTIAAIKSFSKEFASDDDDDALLSREFWLFVGSLLIVISAVHITFQTSLPVFNALLEPFSGVLANLGESLNSNTLRALSEHNMTPSKDLDKAYHLIQVPLATLIFIVIGITQWLKYKKTDGSKVFKNLGKSLIASIATSLILVLSFNFKSHELPRVALLIATSFAVFANADYIWSTLRGAYDKWGSPVAHIGFALTIFGAVISTAQQKFISQNQIGDISSLNEELNNRTDLLLMQGDTLQMGEYFVSYRDRRESGIHVLFDMDYYNNKPQNYNIGDVVLFDDMVFEAHTNHTASFDFAYDVEKFWTFLPFPTEVQAGNAKNWINGTPGEFAFTLSPRIQLNERMGNSPEPDTKHSVVSDLYTHIKWARITPPETDDEGWLAGKEVEFQVGDSMFVSSTLLSLDSLALVKNEDRGDLGLLNKDLAFMGCFSLKGFGKSTNASPLYIVRDSLIIPDLYEVENWGLRFRIDKFDPSSETLTTTIWEHESVKTDFIVIQAIIFPLINVLWLGCILMTLGCFMAVRRRIKLNRDA
ncbi:MAG: cytochrome c biogenesis protein CcsA [Bacteroidota bacterium]|nr:cytochrome c biogenesis protein CcsA [Bacteroidota bacterium]